MGLSRSHTIEIDFRAFPRKPKLFLMVKKYEKNNVEEFALVKIEATSHRDTQKH